MHVRDARPEDAPAIETVARASWHAAYDELLGAEIVAETVAEWYAPASLRAEFSRVADDAGGVFLVAATGRHDDVDDADDADGEVVGYANAGPAHGDDPPADAFLSRLYVHPDRWGEGVGFDLTRAVCRRLRAAGHRSVWLEVFAENDVGRSFYERLGFERVAAVDETFGRTALTTLHMRAPLSRLTREEVSGADDDGEKAADDE